MAAVKKNTYAVQWHLAHNGDKYMQGETIALSDNEAAHLLATGVIKLIEDK